LLIEGFGDTIDNIPIVWVNDLTSIKSACFIITAVYDYQNIYQIIKKDFPNVTILSLEELID